MWFHGAPEESNLELLFETLEAWGAQLKQVGGEQVLIPVDGSEPAAESIPLSDLEPPGGPDFGGPQP